MSEPRPGEPVRVLIPVGVALPPPKPDEPHLEAGTELYRMPAETADAFALRVRTHARRLGVTPTVLEREGEDVVQPPDDCDFCGARMVDGRCRKCGAATEDEERELEYREQRERDES